MTGGTASKRAGDPDVASVDQSMAAAEGGGSAFSVNLGLVVGAVAGIVIVLLPVTVALYTYCSRRHEGSYRLESSRLILSTPTPTRLSSAGPKSHRVIGLCERLCWSRDDPAGRQ